MATDLKKWVACKDETVQGKTIFCAGCNIGWWSELWSLNAHMRGSYGCGDCKGKEFDNRQGRLF